MFDPHNTTPAPGDLGTRTAFEGVVVSIAALIEAATASATPIEGRSFVDCILIGPAVLNPSAETRLKNCNFGDVEGDARNLFLIPAGSRVIGALSVAGCRFDGCLFTGVGLVGDEAFIKAFLAAVDEPA